MAQILKVTLTTSTLRVRLARKGWDHLGEGVFGVAYGRGNLVWKIQAGDGGWAHYIRAVAAGEFCGPHAPRVKVVFALKGGGTAALMERLTDSRRALRGRTVEGYSTPEAIASGLRSLARNVGALRLDDEARSGLKAMPPSLKVYAAELGRWAPEVNSRIDLHAGNFLVRRNGTIVVTDPVA